MSYQFVEDHRDYVRRELKFRMQRRPLYSQRAFSRDLNLSASTLTDYLKDRLALSAGRVSLLSKKMGLCQEQREHWLDLMTYRFNNSPDKKNESLIKIKSRIQSEKNAVSIEEFKVISEWYHFAFLELIDMNSKKYSDIKVSANALSISVIDLKSAIKRMQQLGLLKIDSNQLYLVEKSTQIGNYVPSEAVRQFHSQVLSKATNALETQTMNERYNSSNFIGIPESKISEIIEQLQTVTSKIFEPYVLSNDSKSRESLYCFSLQFFSMLKKKGK